MALQHLRSSTANKRPTPAAMSDGQLAMNTNLASPGLFFKDSNGDSVKIGPVHVGTTAPNATPGAGGQAGNSVGEQWLDTTGGRFVFKIWDGTAFRTEDGEFVNTTGDTMTGALGIIAGSAATPSVFFTGDTNTGIFSPGADQVAISTNGTERLRITSAGLVGIGTSSPATPLHVTGAIRAGSSNSYAQINANQMQLYGSTGSPFIKFADYNLGTSQTAVIGWEDNFFGAGSLAFTVKSSSSGTGITAMTLSPTGQVGIGTTSPGSALEINAAAATSPFIAKINTAEAARIDSSGRLLVGTSTNLGAIAGQAAQKLQIAGSTDGGISMHSFGADAFACNLEFKKSRSANIGTHTIVQNGDTLGKFYYCGSDGTDFEIAASIEAFVDGTPGANDMPGRLVFSTTADGSASPTERMRIASNGNMMLGGTTQRNSARFTIDANGSHAPFSLFAPSTGNYTNIFFENLNGNVGSISTNASATAYNTSSDYRLKENVAAVTDGITRLLQLKPNRFNFIADPNTVVDGFIAHEVQTVVPEAITGEKDAVDADGKPVHQGIDQSKLVPLLTAALQEAVAKIESLEARLTAAGL